MLGVFWLIMCVIIGIVLIASEDRFKDLEARIVVGVILGGTLFCVSSAMIYWIVADDEFEYVSNIKTLEVIGDQYYKIDDEYKIVDYMYVTDSINEDAILMKLNKTRLGFGGLTTTSDYAVIVSEDFVNKMSINDKCTKLKGSNLLGVKIGMSKKDSYSNTSVDSDTDNIQESVRDNLESDSNTLEENADIVNLTNELSSKNEEIHNLNDIIKDQKESIEKLNNTIKNQEESIDKLNKELSDLKTKKKLNTKEVLMIVVSVWIMALISICTIYRMRIKGRRELIQTASDAKIRESVMLDDK